MKTVVQMISLWLLSASLCLTSAEKSPLFMGLSSSSLSNVKESYSSFSSSTWSHPSSVFGIARGGGLFGGGGKKEETKTADIKKFPAMSQEEIEDWLAHIPVFAVTDSNGAGVVLKPDDQTSVFYFFMSPMMANATLTTLKESNQDMDLKISAFSLGKIWFKILNAGDETEVQLRSPGASTDAAVETTKGVQYRLVPDTRDLMGARMLLTMDPADGEKLKAGGTLTPEDAQAAIKKAMTESPKFKETYNEIPVFMIAQMRMQRQSSSDEGGEPIQLLPMYFSLQNMVGTWQQFMSQDPNAQGVEPAINLMDLHELIAKMQEESEIDFRNVLLIPPVPMGSAASADGSNASADGEDAMSSMGGDTLGDL